MIVLRQLCRNRKTMSTVSAAPSMIVCLTPSTLFSTVSADEKVMRRSTSEGNRFFNDSTAALTLLPVSMMLASYAFWMSIVIDDWPFTRANDVSSFSPSTTSATCDR